MTLYIRKSEGKVKDAIRISEDSKIPELLESSIIKQPNGTYQLVCVEGNETAKKGDVIGYEVSTSTPTGFNCWVIGNASTNLIEKDGKFFTKPTVMKAALISENLPDWLQGADVSYDKDTSIWSIKTPWGVSSGTIGEAFWILYGVDANGIVDANILTKTEKSINDYCVCEEDGTFICPLIDLINK